MKIFDTDRLTLRLLSGSDFNALFEKKDKELVMKELGLTTDAEYEKELKKYQKGYISYRSNLALFQIFLKDTEQMIGNCGYHNWSEDHSRAELGYALKSDEFKRKAYMTEALQFVIPYGFNTMQLNRIEAMVGTENIASQKLLLKFGFTKEGIMREHYFVDGEYQDSIIYSLLQSEYEDVETDLNLDEDFIKNLYEDLIIGFECYIHKKSKKFLSLIDEVHLEDVDPSIYEEDLLELKNNRNDYIKIENMYSSEMFEVMKSFATKEIDNQRDRNFLLDQLSMKKPFARFNDFIHNSKYRDQWFEYKNKNYREYVIEFLKSNNIIDGYRRSN